MEKHSRRPFWERSDEQSVVHGCLHHVQHNLLRAAHGAREVYAENKGNLIRRYAMENSRIFHFR